MTSISQLFRDGLPPNMRFSRAASYNNPHMMFPSASKLFSGMNNVAGKLATTTTKGGKKFILNKFTLFVKDILSFESQGFFFDCCQCLGEMFSLIFKCQQQTLREKQFHNDLQDFTIHNNRFQLRVLEQQEHVLLQIQYQKTRSIQ